MDSLLKECKVFGVDIDVVKMSTLISSYSQEQLFRLEIERLLSLKKLDFLEVTGRIKDEKIKSLEAELADVKKALEQERSDKLKQLSVSLEETKTDDGWCEVYHYEKILSSNASSYDKCSPSSEGVRLPGSSSPTTTAYVGSPSSPVASNCSGTVLDVVGTEEVLEMETQPQSTTVTTSADILETEKISDDEYSFSDGEDEEIASTNEEFRTRGTIMPSGDNISTQPGSTTTDITEQSTTSSRACDVPPDNDFDGIEIFAGDDLNLEEGGNRAVVEAPKPKRFSCSYCGRAMKTISILKRHVIRYHELQPPRVQTQQPHRKSVYDRIGYNCQFCSKKFSSIAYLRDHENLHVRGSSVTVRLRCQFCDKTYGSTSARNHHVRKRHSNIISKIYNKI